MKMLVYGAGVIGSLYGALLSEAGFHVTMLARGKRLKDLTNNGLRYEEKGKIKIAKVMIIDKLESNDTYDYILLPVRGDQLKQALCELKSNTSPNIVTMTNTIEKYEELEKLCGKGRIIPAFPGAGGSLDNGILHASLTPKIVQPTTFGEIQGKQTDRIQGLAKIFKKSHIPYQIVSNMHYWQISHLGMVVPIADAYYMSNSPKAVYKDKVIMRETAKRMKGNFSLLAKRKMLSPFKFYILLLCPIPIFTIALSLVFKSHFGDKFMYQHAMKAPQEMRQLHQDLYEYIKHELHEQIDV